MAQHCQRGAVPPEQSTGAVLCLAWKFSAHPCSGARSVFKNSRLSISAKLPLVQSFETEDMGYLCRVTGKL